MMRVTRPTLLAFALLLTAASVAAAAWPTVFFYESSYQSLLAIQVQPRAEPVTLVFNLPGGLPDGFVNQFGDAFFLDRPNDVGELMRELQTALAMRQGERAKPSGKLTHHNIDQLREIARGPALESQIGPVRLINLKRALVAPVEYEPVQLFLDLTNLHRVHRAALKTEQIDNCLPVIVRNLDAIADGSGDRLLMGALRGRYSMSDCLGQREDTDHDGVVDVDEVQVYGTNPSARDTDSDGIPDGKEIELKESFPALNPTHPDTDGDGLSDGDEMILREQGVMVDPTKADTDGDGVADGDELGAVYDEKRFDPANPNTFSDHIGDGEFFRKHVQEKGPGAGTLLLMIGIALFVVVGGLVIFFWQQDKSVRLQRQKALAGKIAPDFVPKPDAPFAKRAPGFGKREDEPSRPMPPAAKPRSLLEEEWEGVLIENVEDDDMPDPEAREAIGKIQGNFDRLEGQLAILSSAVTKIAERLEKMAPQLDGRLKTLEAAVYKIQKQGGVVQDQSILKKFNEQELLITQSMGEMGQMLDGYHQRIERIESQIRLLME
jgi:Bacterial TSP3 repeat